MAVAVLEGQAVVRIDFFRFQQPVIGELFTTQADEHDFPAEIGVPDQVPDRSDGDLGHGSVDGHPAAIGMVHRHHIIHMGILGQQFPADPVHCHIHHPGGTLDGGHHPQQVPGACRTLFVPVAPPGGLDRIRQFFRRNDVGGIGQIMEGRTFRQVQHVFVDPAALGDGVLGIAQDHPVADDLSPFGNILQGDFVGLGNGLEGNHSRQYFRAHRQVMDGNGHIVLVLDLDYKRCSHRISSFLRFLSAGSLLHRIPGLPVHPGLPDEGTARPLRLHNSFR